MLMSINTIRGARSWNQRFLSNSLSKWALMLMTWASLLSKEIQRPVFSMLGKKDERIRTMTIAWIKRKILKEIARRHSMGWEAGKSLIQNRQWWKIRTCNEICEVNIKQEDWNYIACREMGGTSNHVKWNTPYLSKHVFSYVWHTYHESRKGTLWREKAEKEEMRR